NSNVSNSENTELFKNQSDEEKTSTDQDEDIKVSTYNSDEEKTSSEEEIEIPEQMDTEPIVRIFGNKTENIATNDVKPEYPGETSSQPIQPR
ncbi:hypothetical protein Goshw_000869, partial [Gossypium schwendimanii]|nr:hypothetical protein [Gossypium schwendimanii]